MRMKIALYEMKSSSYPEPTQYCFEVTDWMERENSDYIRITETVNVEFKELSRAHIIQDKVNYLRAEKGRKMAEYDEKIAKLLALPNPEDFGIEVEDRRPEGREDEDV